MLEGAPKQKALKCKECNVALCHIQKFITHVNTHLKEEDKIDIALPYICPVCSRRSKTYMALNWHMIMHKKERPYKCDWPGCKWSFTCQRYLTKHIMRHQGHKSYCGRRPSTKIRKFKCSQCNYAACSKQLLEYHENTHTNARPFKCSQCDRAYNSPRNRQIHELNMHSNSKDKHYMCELCGYSSFFKSDLKKHQRIHTGDKPYTCEHCGYRSSRIDNLRKHVRVHTGEKKHKCHYCDLAFYSQQSCKNHEASMHINKRHEAAVPVKIHTAQENNTLLKESASSMRTTPSQEILNPLILNSQPQNPAKESDRSEPTCTIKMTPPANHPQTLSNPPMLVNNPPSMVESRERLYDHSRSEAHRPQIKLHQGPVQSEEQEASLRLQQESLQSEGHGTTLRLQQGPVQSDGQGHGPPLMRPNQGPLQSDGQGALVRPQGPLPTERSQSEWIRAVNFLQHLHQM